MAESQIQRYSFNDWRQMLLENSLFHYNMFNKNEDSGIIILFQVICLMLKRSNPSSESKRLIKILENRTRSYEKCEILKQHNKLKDELYSFDPNQSLGLDIFYNIHFKNPGWEEELRKIMIDQKIIPEKQPDIQKQEESETNFKIVSVKRTEGVKRGHCNKIVKKTHHEYMENSSSSGESETEIESMV
ncbi:hypothetical protein H312_00388 [Anncaliia algerae PRA339]|uniref:Uncharacterized protein n=1 Tax=Anncaliia algerae PRA339 TaxID=1288291 RepID=A0A059F4D0_9MICR|nr:hypothetical protein H312_00388 [Anncaliia algerae PRA339]